ncbi:alkaline phosphatase [Geodermatophilus sp. DSM 44513]|uniref:alkaline phosphatase D family protein n=1 Tax=Geodermatophilus sp. DSM 44513 TaxID=1528104 RepID=UPI00127231F7|nr:alkaline phosphatase D family protein [Geodermatophilus sp. DSM 44513]WNV76646.1 alkaline phosphatase D family protein [Geodermatophilus sp. DSM 44513]
MTTPREVSRRSVLQGAGAAAALLAVGGLSPEAARAAVAETARAGVFGFGVASGDPTGTSVLLWTRVTPDPAAVPGSGLGAPTTVRWELAADEGFRHVLRRGTTRTGLERDHTVKVVVDRLDPYTRYFYRFSALGQTSPVGRTQTSPDEPGTPHALRLAFVSCSNYTGGWFTAYRGIAERDDLDLVLHLGDYLYEYGNEPRAGTGDARTGDRYGPDALAGVRDHQPPVEIVSLEDYRVRHALYKADPDLQAAHLRHPWVTIFDDHEITNDAYDTGAENHEPADDPDTAYTGPMEPPGVLPEGDFLARRQRAFRAYLEWMPIREPGDLGEHPHRGTQFFRRFRFGDLAALSVIDTRQNRSQQVPATAGGAPNPALADPARVLPEPEQLDWLVDGITGGGTAWHLVGNQTVFTRVYAVPRAGVLPGQVFNTDQWDGYQDDQGELLAAMAGSGDTDPVVLSGDIHSSWANDLPADPDGYRTDGGSSVGVEFVCPSITSDGFKEVLGSAAAAQTATAAFQATNPWIRYLEGIGHGFAVIDVTPERVQTDWWFIRVGGDKGLAVDPRLDPAATVGYETSFQSVKGSRRVTGPVGQLGPRADEPRTAGTHRGRDWGRGRDGHR